MEAITANNPQNDIQSRKRGSSTYTELFSLCPQKRRKELFESTIEDWKEPKTTLAFDHPRAQRLNKHLFEHLIMDNESFYDVAKPGFLRMMQIAEPTYKVPSDQFFRSMLDDAYDGIRYVQGRDIHVFGTAHYLAMNRVKNFLNKVHIF